MTRDQRLTKSTKFEVSQETLAEWHFRAGAIHRLIPPWERILVREEAAPLVNGARARIDICKGPLRLHLVALHEEVKRGESFVDVQESGPFAAWRHQHRFLPRDSGSTLEDDICYRLPFGPLGAVIGIPFRKELARQFAFRHARTAADLRRHAEMDARFGARKLRIGVTGARGLVGTQLCAFLSTAGHEIVRFVRAAQHRTLSSAERPWNPDDPEHGVDPRHVEDLDAVIHLAGESIAAGRWNASRKQAILESRRKGTAAISRAIANANTKPSVFLSASAIGFYGHRGDDVVDERSAPGQGFLPEVVRAWEDATVAAKSAGVRTVHLRFGVVLTALGGALQKMRTPFAFGAGGPIGNGRQGFSWVSLDDALGATLFALRNPAIVGPVNVVAPNALPQRGFATVLGRVMRRPAFAPLPAVVVRALFGEMGQRLLLEGAFVRPSVLEREAFRFEHGALEACLRLELGVFHDDGGR